MTPLPLFRSSSFFTFHRVYDISAPLRTELKIEIVKNLQLHYLLIVVRYRYDFDPTPSFLDF